MRVCSIPRPMESLGRRGERLVKPETWGRRAGVLWRPDTSRHCSPQGHLAIAADLPITTGRSDLRVQTEVHLPLVVGECRQMRRRTHLWPRPGRAAYIARPRDDIGVLVV